MQELLDVSLESWIPSVPLAALIGLYVSLDGLAGEETNVGMHFRVLLDQALYERQRVTQKAIRDWSSVGDPSSELVLGDLAYDLWKRLGEIAEAETRLRCSMADYRRVRHWLRYTIGAGIVVASVGFFWPSASIQLTAIAFVIFVLSLLSALYARHVESRLDAFGDEAMFRRPTTT